MELTGKVALITGGARGIGRGIALALAQEGADIAIAEVDRVASAAQQYSDAAVSGFHAARETVKEIAALGRRAVALEADVTQWPQVQRMVSETVSQLGQLDILVCNAGVVHIATVETMPEEE